MLRRIYVDNYKCLVNFELHLEELSLLLGPNGAGKTSVLDVVYAVRRLLGGVARVTDPDVFPTSSLTRWQARDVQVVELELAFPDEPGPVVYRLELEHDRSAERARILLERLVASGGPLFECRRGEVQLYRDDHSEGPKYATDWSESAMARVAERHDNRRLCRVRDFLRNMVVLGLSPGRFQAECRREERRLARDGANFAAWYRHVHQERAVPIGEYWKALQEILDGFKALQLEQVGQWARALMVLFEGKERFQLRLDELSDGERALLVLYALVHLTEGQALLLDEPDNYVALAEIQPFLMALKDACGETIPQAILCSHHPEFIDYLGAESGILLRREVTGLVVPQRVQVPEDTQGLRLSELFARGWDA